jgi:hypothetical protein
MKELKICRREKDRFTVVVTTPNYEAIPHYGVFPDVHYYYRVDTEDELLALLNEEEELFSDEIEIIYYGNVDVTDKYIKFD